ncbi:MAG: hypothetical protein [Circoviridae sp.]|nr:MAG: hypothetical protein [Circoviridae sp.]
MGRLALGASTLAPGPVFFFGLFIVRFAHQNRLHFLSPKSFASLQTNYPLLKHVYKQSAHTLGDTSSTCVCWPLKNDNRKYLCCGINCD